MINKLNPSLLTIGIPFFNDAKYLELAIKSVINQTYQSWILILIDDGSTDDSLQIAKKYEKKDQRIKVISDGCNKNLANRLNQIIDLAETKYIARMDADDIMHPDRVKIQLEIMEKDPSIDVLGTNAYSIDENNIIKGVRYNISEDIVNAKSFIHPSILVKTSWAKNNKYDINATRMQDAILWVKTRNSSVFKCFNIPLIYYREIDSNYFLKYKKGLKAIYNIWRKEEETQYKRIWFKNLIRYFIKTILFYMASILRLEHNLIKRRNILIDHQDLDYAYSSLKFIKHER